MTQQPKALREAAGRKKRCKAAIWVKDVPRYTGRGLSGFEMHYNQQQCSFAALDGQDFCRRHTNDGVVHLKLDWHEFTEPRKRKRPAVPPAAGKEVGR